jgi:hypothetical protein
LTLLLQRPSVDRADSQTLPCSLHRAAPNTTICFLLLFHLTDFHCCCNLLKTISNACLGYIAATSSFDYASAISRSCNVLDRLSPLFVLTVEFQVHRQVRSASILALVVLIGVLLQLFGAFSRYPPAPSSIDYASAISRSCNVLDRLLPLSVLTVEFQVHRQV